ncbi:unnamed protein product [Closterium sp. NIES-54]
MGRHLATFTCRPGSSLYTLTTKPRQVAASGQVFASGLKAAPCSCRLLSHQTLLWHHRLGNSTLPRLRGMHSCLLVSGLPRSLPPLPPSPASPCLPCVEGRQRAAPHSSFPPTTAPLQTLHMDMGRERYFLLVVDYMLRLQLREQFREDLPVLRLHSNQGGEFSSDLLRDFCRGEGILQSFTLPASSQQNRVAECRIGLVMEVARTSMIHAAAPHFLWPFAPTLRWTGKVGDALVFRVWGSRAFVLDTSADKLSSHAIPCVFLGFPPDAPGWNFYHPTSRRVLPSQDVTFDELVPFYCLFPYRTAPLPSLAALPRSRSPTDSGTSGGGAARGAASGGAEPTGAEPVGGEPASAEPGGAEPEGAEPRGAETEGAEPGGAESEGAESGGAEPRGTASARGPAGSGGPAAGDTGAGGPGATSPRGVRPVEDRRIRTRRRTEPGGGRDDGGGGTKNGRHCTVPPAPVPPAPAPPAPAPPAPKSPALAPPATVPPAPDSPAPAPPAPAPPALAPLAPVPPALAPPAPAPPAPAPPAPGSPALVPPTPPAPAAPVPLVRALPGPTAPAPPVPQAPAPPAPAPPAPWSPAPAPPTPPTPAALVPLVQAPPGPAAPAPLGPPAPAVTQAPLGLVAPAPPAPVSPAAGPPAPAAPLLWRVRRANQSRSYRCERGSRRRDCRGEAPAGPLADAVPLGSAPRDSAPSDSAPPGSAPSVSAPLGSAPSSSAPPGSALADSAPTGSAPVGSAPPDAAPLAAPPSEPDSPLLAPSPYTEQADSLPERREPASCHASPVRVVRTGRRVPRLRPPPIPGTRIMALRSSSIPLRAPLPSPPASSLVDGPDPETDLVRAASPTVTRLLATVVTYPSFESAAASALVAELVDFAAACRLDYAASLVAESESDCPSSVGGECALGTYVLEDRQEDFDCLATAVHHLVAMLLAPEGDPDAPDIPTPRSYAEAITGPYSSQWQTAMDAEMASWMSTGTYVNAFPPPGANIVDGMWIFRVKRPPGSPPVFKARYVARGFIQRQGVDFFKTFSPTPKMTTLWSNPLPTGHLLSAPPSDKSIEPSGPSPEFVGCLMYLMTSTRPGLAYPLSIRARYVAPGRHRPEHWEAAKRVSRYLCSTSGMGLMVGGRGPVVLTGHAGAFWVVDLATQRTSQGYTFSLGSGSVSWRSTRSSSFLSSSCEAEIYAGAMAAHHLRWLTYLQTDLGEQPRSFPVLYVENKAMIALCQEHRLEHRTKHIALRYFLARELQQGGQLRLA